MDDYDVEMLRATIMRQIRSIRVKFKKEYGELVLCCESGSNWRKEVFPYYKARRAKKRETQKLDWKVINADFRMIQDEIEEHFPYKVVKVPYAEGDDVVAALAMRYGAELGDGEEKILIVSNDKDFGQLQMFSNVRQWYSAKGFIEHSNPELYLKELIISGDSGDDVPNALSEDNCFMVGKRQTVMTPKRKAILLNAMDTGVFPEGFEVAKRRIMRNAILIDFRKIPKHIIRKIHEEYDRERESPKGRLFDYFFKHGLRNQLEDIKDYK